MMAENEMECLVRPPPLPQWQSVSQLPELDAGDLHVWLIEIDELLRLLLEASLSEPERERAAAFRFRSHQNQYVVARGALRFMLGQYLGQPARNIEIAYADGGKPFLSPRFLPSIKFNLSHSHQYVLLALAHEQELGIDIELRDPQAIDEGLLSQCLTSTETLTYEHVLPEERTEFFFDLWTRKEAYLKLVGDGLGIPPNEFSLSLMRSGSQTIRGDQIYFTETPVIENFSSSLATGKEPTKVHFYTLGFHLLT